MDNDSKCSIESVKTFLVGKPSRRMGGENWVFLKLVTEDGVTGVGECNVPFYRERTLVRLIEEVSEQYLIGANPFNIEELRVNLSAGSHYFRPKGMLSGQVISAVEMACWDIVGKLLDQPVYNLLGGKCHDELKSYTYMFDWKSPDDPPEKAGEVAQSYVEKGFSAVKFDPVRPIAPSPRDISRKELNYAEASVEAVRDSVGDSCEILIGTHGQLNTHSAIRLARRLESYEPLWFEEPVPPENVDQLLEVARSTSIPIATGERFTTVDKFREVLEKGAAQILQVNVGLHGILGAKKIAGFAEPYYAQIAPWMHCGPVAGAAAIQLDMCSPNFLIQEGLDTWGGFGSEILEEPIEWKDGMIIPPEGPGLGVVLDEDKITGRPYNKYEFPWA